MPDDETEDIILPVFFGIKAREADGVSISTRSTINLIQILRAGTEIPSEHIAKGLAAKFPKPGLVGASIHIHSSATRPDTAAIAVRYRGYWFYIDDSDAATKRFYMMLRTLWSVTISASFPPPAT